MIQTVLTVYPVLVTGLIALTLAYALPRYFVAGLRLTPAGRFARFVSADPLPRRQGHAKCSAFRVALCVLLSFALSRLAVFAVGFVGSAIRHEIPEYMGRIPHLFTQWDADHYLGIARNGYVNETDARYHIVFYPFYPLVVRAFSLLTAGNLTVSAVIVSNVCLLLSGCFLFRVAEGAYSRSVARQTVWFFMFAPAGMFFSIAYTESLFFLLTVLSVYFAGKRRFLPALLSASLASFTRLPGVVCAVPVFYEMLRHISFQGRTLRAERKRAFLARRVLVAFCLCLTILSGFIGYLVINRVVTGNAFQFLVYQREHWGQRAGTVWNTARYTIFYAFFPNVDWYQRGIWIPQSAFLLLTALLLFFERRRLRPGDLAYAVVYYIVTVSPTMLLSGPRYLCALYALYPALARASNARPKRILICTLYAALFLYCAWMFTIETILL